MSRSTATTPKALPVAERKARLAALVKAGKVSSKRAKLVDFREPTQREKDYGEMLAARLREAKAV